MVLHGQGLSVRSIAKRTGLNRMKVHRIIAARLSTLDNSPDDGDEPMALLDGTEDDHRGPFTFVGVGDEHEVRLCDANGVSCGLVDAWRWCMASDAACGWTGSFWEDLMASIQAAGARQVADPQPPGFTRWVQD
jgi:hypothetical protein